MVEFGYIKVAFDKVQDFIKDGKKILYIVGKECSGKSYLLDKLSKFYRDKKSILKLTSPSSLQNLEYGVFISALSKGHFYKGPIVTAISSYIGHKNDTAGLISDFIINYRSNSLEYLLPSLSETEIDILNRIALSNSDNELMILADDIDKWDSDSRNLLFKIIAIQNNIENVHFNNLQIVITAINDYQIDKLDKKDIVPYEINCDLSSSAFTKEAQNIGITDTNLISALFNVTSGNIGLVQNIKEYVDLSALKTTETIEKQLFKLLEQRIISSENITDEIYKNLQAASVIGKEFNILYLEKLTEASSSDLDFQMDVSCGEKLISREEIEDYMYEFSTELLYKFFYEKLNGKSKSYHYKMAKVLEKLAPHHFYLRYIHMEMSGRKSEAIPLLTIHCIRQCLAGSKPSDKFIDIIKKSDSYWNVYYNIHNAINEYRSKTEYSQIYNSIQSSDMCVDSMVNVEKDYVLCLLKYRTGKVDDYKEIEVILSELFEDTQIDFSQHIRIGVLLYLLYCNRLENISRAQEIERKLVKQLQEEIHNCPDLEREIRILERVSPALYSNEVAYTKTQRSLSYFESRKNDLGKEYIMSLTNYIGVSLYLVGSIVDSELSWNKLYDKSLLGVRFLNQTFNMNYYGIPKFLNNYLLVGFLSEELSGKQCIEIYDLILTQKGHLPSRPLLECNRLNIQFMIGEDEDCCNSIGSLYQKNVENSYYSFVTGINYVSLLIYEQNYAQAKKVFDRLDFLIPAISRVDGPYIKARYEIYESILQNKIAFKSLQEYSEYFSNLMQEKFHSLPDIWKIPIVFSDLQYWSEF